MLAALVNAASFSDEFACSPNSLATLFGRAFVKSSSTRSAGSFPIPVELAGTRILVNGEPVPVLFISITQANIQCPNLPAGTRLEVVVETAFGRSNTLEAVMGEARPR